MSAGNRKNPYRVDVRQEPEAIERRRYVYLFALILTAIILGILIVNGDTP